MTMLWSPLATQWEANVVFVVHKLYLHSSQTEQLCSGGCVTQSLEELVDLCGQLPCSRHQPLLGVGKQLYDQVLAMESP